MHGAILAAMKSLPLWGRARHTALSTLLGKVPTSQLVRGGEDIDILYKHLSQELISSHVRDDLQPYSFFKFICTLLRFVLQAFASLTKLNK